MSSRKEELIKNLKEMQRYKDITFSKLLIRAFYTIKPSKKKLTLLIIIFIGMLYPGYMIIESDSTINILSQIIEKSNTVIMALFAIVFTGYALFQALVNRNTLKNLFVSKGTKYILFDEYNLYFFELAILYVFLIAFNYIFNIIVLTINPNIIPALYKNILNIFLNGFISLYVTIIFFSIIEIKSFILNLFQCFNISATSSMIESLKELDDNLRELPKN